MQIEAPKGTFRIDMSQKMIRTIGDPDHRFTENPLRIMQAVSLAAQFGFPIEQETKDAIRRHAAELQHIPPERIAEELTKIICSPHPETLETMYELGITAQFFPEFDRMMKTEQNTPYHYTDVGHHTIAVMQNVSPTKEMRYAALLHDIGKPLCKTTDEQGIDHFKTHADVGEPLTGTILRRFGMDDKMIEHICRLVKWHDFGIDGKTTEEGFRRAMSKIGIENFPEYLELRMADMAGQSDYRKEWKLGNIERIVQMYDKVMEENQKFSILAVSEKDMQDLGIEPGSQMGQVMSHLLDMVQEEPSKNESETLKTEAKKLAARQRMEKSLKDRQETARKNAHNGETKGEAIAVGDRPEK